MKTTIKTLFLATSAMISVSACSSDDSLTPNKNISVENVFDSGCLEVLGSRALSAEETISFSVENVGKEFVLHINHDHGWYNCATENVDVQIHASDDGCIHIHEIESDVSANCSCEHNLSYDINRVEKGTYRVLLFRNVEKVAEFEPSFQINVDVANGKKNTYRIN